MCPLLRSSASICRCFRDVAACLAPKNVAMMATIAAEIDTRVALALSSSSKPSIPMKAPPSDAPFLPFLAFCDALARASSARLASSALFLAASSADRWLASRCRCDSAAARFASSALICSRLRASSAAALALASLRARASSAAFDEALVPLPPLPLLLLLLLAAASRFFCSSARFLASSLLAASLLRFSSAFLAAASFSCCAFLFASSAAFFLASSAAFLLASSAALLPCLPPLLLASSAAFFLASFSC
mmetsp:Transcript_24436/g.47495  ORF Transcript_24436/g.47495 Transcript_24436/m.47495 type:complete len:249 (-) Transcript_24436:620-1366(-)